MKVAITTTPKTARASRSRLRVEYASVLGWTSGLVVAMLSQLDAAGASRGLEAPPGR